MTDLEGKYFGRYKIVEKLGEGGMAAVYKAYDERLERSVALKVILTHQQQSDSFLSRFEVEAKSLAQLSHTNIVKVLDYGEEEGIPYLVMENVSGGSLKELIDEKDFTYQEAAAILAPIARALEYVHSHKIIHRDVKPSNILITESGEPMLSDFGIVKIIEEEEIQELTGTGVGLGTPDYMSPEQGAGKEVDHRADLYALGLVFYEMVTGRKAYQADTPMAMVIKQVTEPLPKPRAFVNSLPASVEQVILKSIAKNPDDRFPTIGEFAEILEMLARGEMVRMPMPRKKLMLIVGGVSAVFLGALIMIAMLISFSNKRERNQQAMEQTVQQALTLSVTPTLPSTSVPVFSNETVEATSVAESSDVKQVDTEVVLSVDTATPTPTPELHFPLHEGTSLPDSAEVISPGNVEAIKNVVQYGIGKINQVVWSPDGEQITVASGAGVYFYEPGKLDLVDYIFADDWINSVAFSPDGKLIVSGSRTGRVNIWDAENKELISELSGHDSEVWYVAFSPSGRYIASGSDDKSIIIWDVASEQQLRKFSGVTVEVKCLAFSPDDRFLASGSLDGSIKLWDLAKGQLHDTFDEHGSWVSGVTFSPDGKYLASSSRDSRVKLWEVGTGRIMLNLGGSSTTDVYGDPVPIGVWSVSFSPDGEFLALGLDNKAVELWDLETGKVVWSKFGERDHLFIDREIRSLQGLCGESGQKLWGRNSRKYWGNDEEVWTNYKLCEGFDYVNTVAFSPDGKSLAVGSWDSTLRLINPSNGAIMRERDLNSGSVGSLAFSPDGSVIALGAANSEVDVWRIAEGNKLYTLDGYFPMANSDPFTPDSSLLALVSNSYNLSYYEVANGGPAYGIGGQPEKNSEIRSIDFSPDGRLMYSEVAVLGGETNAVVDFSSRSETEKVAVLGIWDVASGQRLATKSVFVPGCVLAFSSDERFLAGRAASGYVEEWTTTQERICAISSDRSMLSPDKKLIAKFGGYYIEIWDMNVDASLWRVANDYTTRVNGFAFSPDQTILVVSTMDGQLQFWDVGEGEMLKAIQAHADGIMSLAYSQDGLFVATGSWDGAVRLWAVMD